MTYPEWMREWNANQRKKTTKQRNIAAWTTPLDYDTIHESEGKLRRMNNLGYLVKDMRLVPMEELELLVQVSSSGGHEGWHKREFLEARKQFEENPDFDAYERFPPQDSKYPLGKEDYFMELDLREIYTPSLDKLLNFYTGSEDQNLIEKAIDFHKKRSDLRDKLRTLSF